MDERLENRNEADRVRIDIPDETDVDHQYHGAHGEVLRVLADDAARTTGDPQDSELYRVKLDRGETVDFRRRDLRPPFE